MNSLPAAYQGQYDPQNPKAYKISRSKIDLFLEYPRCFYLDRRLRVGRPQTPPFTLNSAVDSLLKTEFDTYRARDQAHPLQTEYGIDAKPAPHPELGKWRENFHGVQYYHSPTNFLLFGAIDDLWINSQGEYLVVDYKATAKAEAVVEMGEERWHHQYRRQIEFYQWLLRRIGHRVSSTGYWVYCTGDPHGPSFDRKLEFRVHLIPYVGDDGWIEPVVERAYQCLNSQTLPESGSDCGYCRYFTQRGAAEIASPPA